MTKKKEMEFPPLDCSLADIWSWSAKNLEQVRGGNFGDATKQIACAKGAIAFVLSRGRSVAPYYTLGGPSNGKLWRRYESLCSLFETRRRKSISVSSSRDTRDIVTLNDKSKWKFSSFARMAKKLGV